MSVCTYCRNAALWGSLSREGRAKSPLTFDRPSRLGSNAAIDHHPDISALIESSRSCRICKILSAPESLQTYRGWSVKLACTGATAARSFTTVLEMELWDLKDPGDPSYSFVTVDPPRFGVCSNTGRYSHSLVSRSPECTPLAMARS